MVDNSQISDHCSHSTRPVRARVTAFAIAAALLAGCVHMPPPGVSGYIANDFGNPSSTSVTLHEPADDEVVIVINLNTPAGNHAGMFVGSRLSDPAGSYLTARSREADWQGQSLRDYIRFQQDDGYRIHAYRFRVSKTDIDTIVRRVVDFGPHAPLFCAADVQNQITGVGPFGALKPVWWTSPASLADELGSLVNRPLAQGICMWPDGQPCSAEVQSSECKDCTGRAAR